MQYTMHLSSKEEVLESFIAKIRRSNKCFKVTLQGHVGPLHV